MTLTEPTGDATTTSDATPHAIGELSQITRAMVSIYKDQYGRGPRNAHSHYCGADAITCILEGTLTVPERTLATLGEHQNLRATRSLFQYAGEDAFRTAVEAITGRRVIAFNSGIDTKADIASELFILDPLVARRVLPAPEA
jgi:uncharacterized protein YbcI